LRSTWSEPKDLGGTKGCDTFDTRLFRFSTKSSLNQTKYVSKFTC